MMLRIVSISMLSIIYNSHDTNPTLHPFSLAAEASIFLLTVPYRYAVFSS